MEAEQSEIILVSGACCMPSLDRVEKDLEQRLRLTVAELGSQAEVKIVSLSSILSGTAAVAPAQTRLIQALFQRYGARMAPAGMVGERVLFAGGAPAPDKLTEMLKTL